VLQATAAPVTEFRRSEAALPGRFGYGHISLGDRRGRSPAAAAKAIARAQARCRQARFLGSTGYAVPDVGLLDVGTHRGPRVAGRDGLEELYGGRLPSTTTAPEGDALASVRSRPVGVNGMDYTVTVTDATGPGFSARPPKGDSAGHVESLPRAGREQRATYRPRSRSRSPATLAASDPDTLDQRGPPLGRMVVLQVAQVKK